MKKDNNAIQKATLPQYINMLYLRSKLAWAEWMERQSTKLGRRGQYIALGVFVTVSCSCCLLLILGAPGDPIKPIVHPTPISKVKPLVENPSPVQVAYDSLTYKRVRAFRTYMDSLARSPSGQRTRDSILKARPGLPDSIAMYESIINNRKIRKYEKQ